MLPDLEADLLLAAGGVQEVPRHLVIDLQHAELYLNTHTVKKDQKVILRHLVIDLKHAELHLNTQTL